MSYLREFLFIRIVVQLYIYQKITIIIYKAITNNYNAPNATTYIELLITTSQLLTTAHNCFQLLVALYNRSNE